MIILILLMGAASVFFARVIAVLLIAIIANKTFGISLKEKLHLLFKEANVLKWECLKLFNSLNCSGGFLSACVQRATLQLKAQRQLEEVLESRLQRLQTNIQSGAQPCVQPVAPVSSDAAHSTDINLSAGK